MQDTVLHQYLIGMKSPWTVYCVKQDINGQCVNACAEHPVDMPLVFPFALAGTRVLDVPVSLAISGG